MSSCFAWSLWNAITKMKSFQTPWPPNMAARSLNDCCRCFFSSSSRLRLSCSSRISSSNLLVLRIAAIYKDEEMMKNLRFFFLMRKFTLASKKSLAPPTPTSSTLISHCFANIPKPESSCNSPAAAFRKISINSRNEIAPSSSSSTS